MSIYIISGFIFEFTTFINFSKISSFQSNNFFILCVECLFVIAFCMFIYSFIKKNKIATKLLFGEK